jgi:hypothetical protein
MTDTDYVEREIEKERKLTVGGEEKSFKLTGDIILTKPQALFRVARAHRPRVMLTTEFTLESFVCFLPCNVRDEDERLTIENRKG